MIPMGRFDARNCGDSHVRRGYMPIALAQFDSCLRLMTFAAKKAVCIINLRHSLRLPSGRPWSPGPPKPSACRRPSPYAVPRIDDASRSVRPNIRARKQWSYDPKADFVPLSTTFT
jgi:hypothetical protein